jgi:glycine C-acetyltransferase
VESKSSVHRPLSFLGDELTALKAQGNGNCASGRCGGLTTIDGREVVNLSSNYLGLTTHHGSRRRHWTRSNGGAERIVRTIAGTMAIHMELERKLAGSRKQAAVVFQSGFAANAGTVAAILPRTSSSRRLNHASIIDVAFERATIKVFRTVT